MQPERIRLAAVTGVTGWSEIFEETAVRSRIRHSQVSGFRTSRDTVLQLEIEGATGEMGLLTQCEGETGNSPVHWACTPARMVRVCD